MSKFAVVTGASTGIGLAICQMLGAEGYQILMIGRNQKHLEDAVNTMRENGRTVFPFLGDLRKLETIENIRSEVESRWGQLAVLVHAAGVWHNETVAFAGTPLANTPSDQIDEVLDVNIRAPMQLSRALLPALEKIENSKVLSISGTFASGGAGWLHYYVSKLALEHFTVGLSQELRPKKIQVNCISPSDTNTEALRKFFPDDAQTALQPSDIAVLAQFLLCGESQHITGQTIVIKNRDA
jgi:3-oxoacyl-[acyl-carrier protein] reductase